MQNFRHEHKPVYQDGESFIDFSFEDENFTLQMNADFVKLSVSGVLIFINSAKYLLSEYPNPSDNMMVGEKLFMKYMSNEIFKNKVYQMIKLYATFQ